MKSINVELLLGHDIGVSGHYYRPIESDVLEDYMTHAVDALTISDEHRLKRQVQQLELKHSQEWRELKAELNELLYPLGPIPRDEQKCKNYYKLFKRRYIKEGHNRLE